MTPAERRRVVEDFFAAHSRPPAGPFGLGQAILDFQAWEVSSGRIAAAGGSDWWRGVNGVMVLDIAAAIRGDATASPAVAAWLDYATAPDPQAALWEAHQRSLHAGVRVCAGLLAHETDAEREFAATVVDLVDRTALAGTPTGDDGLARMTERFYPQRYPIQPEALAALELMREKTASRLLDADGQPFANVGVDSTRWD